MNSIAINFVDCAIIVLYLIFIIWWGLRNGKSSDAGSYFLAGRTMPWWIVGLSLFAASISSTTLIGQSGDAYHTGVAVFNYNLTGVVEMVFFATFLLPLYIGSGIFTIPEFLERRFDKRSRYYFSGICIVGLSQSFSSSQPSSTQAERYTFWSAIILTLSLTPLENLKLSG